ncbi:hypothetical protein [Peptostreptococcus sp. D1]|nr:hypothetical protein [Peptostreptococcus sp. D1]SFE95755.1 hypothetical protein SAMN02910278_02163 [Peptostreptococcus sp. D1]
MKNEKILIPDEVITDYTASDDEREKQEKEYRERAKEAFEKLGIDK